MQHGNRGEGASDRIHKGAEQEQVVHPHKEHRAPRQGEQKKDGQRAKTEFKGGKKEDATLSILETPFPPLPLPVHARSCVYGGCRGSLIAAVLPGQVFDLGLCQA